MKHTKGTWEPCKYGTRPNLKNAVVVWHEDHHTPIAKCVGDKSQANAHLIASAPEMLAMLKELCYKWIEKSNGGQKLLIDDNSINQELLHLIAKAEGGE